ncbi:hypothetical protein QOT17_002609 [Balamuthia mandrillaris]
MDERVTTQASCYFDFLGETVDPVRLVEEIKEKLGDEKEKFQDNKAWLGERLGSNVVRQDPCGARAPSVKKDIRAYANVLLCSLEVFVGNSLIAEKWPPPCAKRVQKTLRRNH